MMTDSLIGATVQAQFRAASGALTEREGDEATAFPLIRGRRWVTNEVVNLACTLTGAATGAILSSWLVN